MNYHYYISAGTFAQALNWLNKITILYIIDRILGIICICRILRPNDCVEYEKPEAFDQTSGTEYVYETR